MSDWRPVADGAASFLASHGTAADAQDLRGGVKFNTAERALMDAERRKTPPSSFGEAFKSIGRGAAHGLWSFPALGVETLEALEPLSHPMRLGGEAMEIMAPDSFPQGTGEGWRDKAREAVAGVTGLDHTFDYDANVNNARKFFTGDSMERGDWAQFGRGEVAMNLGLEYGTELLAPGMMVLKGARAIKNAIGRGGNAAADKFAAKMLPGADNDAIIRWNGLSSKIREALAKGDHKAVRKAAAAKGDLAAAAAGGGQKGNAARARMLAEGEKLILDHKTKSLQTGLRAGLQVGRGGAAVALPGAAAMHGDTIEQQENAGRVGQLAFAAPSIIKGVTAGAKYGWRKFQGGASEAGKKAEGGWERMNRLADERAAPAGETRARVDDVLDLFFDGQTYRLPKGIDPDEIRPLLNLAEDPKLIGRLKEGARVDTIRGRQVLDATNIPPENWAGALGTAARMRDEILEAGGKRAQSMVQKALSKVRVPAAQTIDDIPEGIAPATNRAQEGAMDAALRNPDGTSRRGEASQTAYQEGQKIIDRAASRRGTESVLSDAGRVIRGGKENMEWDVASAYQHAAKFAKSKGLEFRSPINHHTLAEFEEFERMFGSTVPRLAKLWMQNRGKPPKTMDGDMLADYYQRLTKVGNNAGSAKMSQFVKSQKEKIEEIVLRPAKGTPEDGAEFWGMFRDATQKFKRLRADHHDFDTAQASRAAHSGQGNPTRILRGDGTIDYHSAASILRGTSYVGGKYGDYAFLPEQSGIHLLGSLARAEVFEGAEKAANPMAFVYKAYQGLESAGERARGVVDVAGVKKAKSSGGAGPPEMADSLTPAVLEAKDKISTVVRRQIVDSVFQKLYSGDSERFLEQMLRNKRYAEFVRDRMAEIDGGGDLLRARLAARMATGHNSDAAQWNTARVILGDRTDEIREWARHRGKDVRKSLSNLYSNSFSAASDRPAFSLGNYDTLRRQFGDEVAEGMAMRKFWDMFGGHGGVDGGEALRRAEGVLAGVRGAGSEKAVALAGKLEGRMEALAMGALGSGEKNIDDLISFLRNAGRTDDGGRAEALLNRIGRYANNNSGARGAAGAMVRRRIFERMSESADDAGGLPNHVSQYREVYERMLGGGKRGTERFREMYLISMMTSGLNRIHRATEPAAQQGKVWINEVAGLIGTTVGTIASRIHLARGMQSPEYAASDLAAKTLDAMATGRLIKTYRAEVLTAMGRDASMEAGYGTAFLKHFGDYLATGDLPKLDKWLAREVAARPYLRSGIGNMGGQGEWREPQGTNPEDDERRWLMGEQNQHYRDRAVQRNISDVREALQ